jgi:hypothetical protein
LNVEKQQKKEEKERTRSVVRPSSVPELHQIGLGRVATSTAPTIGVFLHDEKRLANRSLFFSFWPSFLHGVPFGGTVTDHVTVWNTTAREGFHQDIALIEFKVVDWNKTRDQRSEKQIQQGEVVLWFKQFQKEKNNNIKGRLPLARFEKAATSIGAPEPMSTATTVAAATGFLLSPN